MADKVAPALLEVDLALGLPYKSFSQRMALRLQRFHGQLKVRREPKQNNSSQSNALSSPHELCDTDRLIWSGDAAKVLAFKVVIRTGVIAILHV